MGIQDRDWWRTAQRDRDRERLNLDRELQKLGPSRGSSWLGAARWGYVPVLAFWFLVMGVVYVAIDHVMKPKSVVVTATGEVRIPRSRDGHFYIEGSVNGQAITFLVDTGASGVVVSEAFARRAGLTGGEPTTFSTANGQLAGHIHKDIHVTAGPLSVSAVKVGVGLVGSSADKGLLGQSFLRKFRMNASDQEMVLQP